MGNKATCLRMHNIYGKCKLLLILYVLSNVYVQIKMCMFKCFTAFISFANVWTYTRDLGDILLELLCLSTKWGLEFKLWF